MTTAATANAFTFQPPDPALDEVIDGWLDRVDARDPEVGDADLRAIALLGDAAAPRLAWHISAHWEPTEGACSSEASVAAAFTALLTIDTRLSTREIAWVLTHEDSMTHLFNDLAGLAKRSESRNLSAALIAEYFDTEDEWARSILCEVLAQRPERREEIFSVLLVHLFRQPAIGADALAHYGDARALPALYEALDAIPEEEDTVPWNRSGLLDVVRAIEALGGEVTGERRRRVRIVRRERRRRREAERERLERRDALEREQAEIAALQPVPRALRRSRPNAPCPCGSGKKTKKCCG